MKKLLIALIVAVASPLHARILTVSNTSYSPGQYLTFDEAHLAAFPNDTIYVHGSTINYGPIFINRPGLTVIGTGHNPQKQFPFVSAFTDISINAPDITIIGVVANVILHSGRNFTLRRCMIRGGGFGDDVSISTGFSGTANVLIESNVFTNENFTRNLRLFWNAGDVISIRNNVFSSQIDPSGPGIPNSFEIANNLFLHGPNAFGFIDKATISNNIFYGSSPFVPNSSTITMRNNISFQCGNNFFTTGPFITNIANLEDEDPMLVNYPGPGVDDVYSYLHDYHLAPGSPCILSGSDGTDRGLYGGFGTIFNMEGEPPIAEITQLLITSPTTVQPGGILNITVTTRRVH